MAPNPRRQDEKLDALYATLPVLACKGLCTDSCGPLEMSIREANRIGGVPEQVDGYCEHLIEGRCAIYHMRPMICRLWGMTEGMPCPHGCEPVGGHISDAACAAYIKAADEIGGVPAGRRARLRAHIEDELKVIDGVDDELAIQITDWLERRSHFLHEQAGGLTHAD